jgi:hypothetical protein
VKTPIHTGETRTEEAVFSDELTLVVQVPLQSFVNQLTASLGAFGATLRSPEDLVALSFQDCRRYLQFAASRTGGIQCR